MFNNNSVIADAVDKKNNLLVAQTLPLLSIVLNEETQAETEKNPETNTNSPKNVDTLISKGETTITSGRPNLSKIPDTSTIGRLQATLTLVKEGCKEKGMILRETVPDQEILSKLIREGMVFEPKEGYVKDV